MDVDDDSDDNHGNDAGMGFLGSIVPDEDDDVSDMLLAQLGSKKYGTPSRPMPSNQHPTQTPSDFHCDVANSSPITPSAASANPTPGTSARRCAGL